ncbi:hypothetical protein BDB00DRAFT_876648 [Zychaea mexicana]|uniref:uncharacterized protein n=1 Tax=Zychaea mexicana TaxID=64656 RepID=UPI0022FE2B2E|nr:uncharacterized protein BDB00DRAFT_876648 [Zychaea mexicana]KAI9489198.1 hypothetical protein BDB00DRAFT_876648 [Zychaea mexicana]
MTAIACLTGACIGYLAITHARTVVVVHELSPATTTVSFIHYSVQCAPIVLSGMHIIDVILNNLPRTDVGLTNGKWQSIWPAILRILREIDQLCHPKELLLDGTFPGDDFSPPLSSEQD